MKIVAILTGSLNKSMDALHARKDVKDFQQSRLAGTFKDGRPFKIFLAYNHHDEHKVRGYEFLEVIEQFDPHHLVVQRAKTLIR